ncbi:MAG TPA: hypothetical protein VL614_14930 [Acetobacteraceae bacterium]|jgi:hypothetical protein|nr:hypothetical protein [Acetobacteraceae bacterium]
MVSYASIQAKIDYGKGKAGQKLGQPYSAYRITAAASGDFPSGWESAGTGIPILRRRINERLIESALEYAGTLWYNITADMTDFLLGDVFVCTDPAYSPGISYGTGATAVPGGSEYEIDAFALAWHMPINKAVGARIDRRCQIFRPLDAPGKMADGTYAWRQANDQSTPLVLTGGVYNFDQPGAAGSFIPIGLSSTARPGRGEMFPPGIPAMPGVTRYYGYVPFLPGYEAAEGDRIITEDGARYVVANPYRQEQGVVGQQLALERMISQVA